VARKHGYDYMIDYQSEDFVQRVGEITGGNGVDVVFDSVGKDTYPGSLQCLKRFGTMVNFGQSSGPALDFKLSDLAVGSFAVSRPILFHYTEDRPWLEKASEELFQLIERGVLSIAVNQQFDLEQAALAHKAIEERRSTGSTVLTV
ncbi:MAG: zinc-binding dehydrogenase, partial [Rhodothermales bacterium]|nr:zinc-binding dehydrogenase [Rhodothermales bacterium]